MDAPKVKNDFSANLYGLFLRLYGKCNFKRDTKLVFVQRNKQTLNKVVAFRIQN